jgi:acetoin utilization deacetylase AcuC-like enzyme
MFVCFCSTQIFPRLMEFQPDMIFISAGFDAHKKDVLNGGYIALVTTASFTSKHITFLSFIQSTAPLFVQFWFIYIIVIVRHNYV